MTKQDYFRDYFAASFAAFLKKNSPFFNLFSFNFFFVAIASLKLRPNWFFPPLFLVHLPKHIKIDMGKLMGAINIKCVQNSARNTVRLEQHSFSLLNC